jgi:Fe-S-cluster containining protein
VYGRVVDDDDALRLQAVLRRLDSDGRRALADVAALREQLVTLIEILVHAGRLGPGHVELLRKVSRDVEVRRHPPIELSTVDDKYQETGEPIDCASRLPLCQARCCSFDVRLSRQDLEEGELAWDIDHPYRLVRDADGYCRYVDRDAGGGCTRYDVRPATCRSYSCRDDNRVWLDFDARIPAPMPDTVIPLDRLTRGR